MVLPLHRYMGYGDVWTTPQHESEPTKRVVFITQTGDVDDMLLHALDPFSAERLSSSSGDSVQKPSDVFVGQRSLKAHDLEP